MSADRFTTGKSTDCLIDNRLENRGRQIFASCPLIDERLNICLGKYTASGGDRINCLIILCVLIFMEP